MPSIAIRAASWYLPPTTLAVKDLPELHSLSPDERETCLALGIEEIRTADDLDTVDLALYAARRTLADAGLAPQDLDALIVVEPRAPEAFVASEVTRLQSLLGAERALAFSTGGLGCDSLTPALLTARGLLSADPDIRHVLVAHGSKPAAPHRYRHPVTIYGDSGQALLLAREGPLRIVDILLENNGAYWDLFRVDYRDQPQQQWHEVCTDLGRYSFTLTMETRARLTTLHRRLLERNGLRPADINHHVSQNTSLSALRFYEETLGAPLHSACRDNLRRYGHLGANDPLLNLYAALDQDTSARPTRAVVLNASPTASWSVVLVEGGFGRAGRAHSL